jgi:hypothetical protein
MKLVNATKMAAGYTMGVRPDGRELLVVVVKGTFTWLTHGEPVRLAEQQQPLVETDEFTGEPGFSAPRYEMDFAPTKPHCDVLLQGTAYAPKGRPAQRVTVSLRVGSWQKSFDVVGKRTWTQSLLSLSSTSAEPFTTMPIFYDNAFGGVDRGKDDSDVSHYFSENHAGVGYHVRISPKLLEGKPLPNTEETGKVVTKPDGYYRPMSFGPLGRSWKQRIQYAGTYDQHWLDNVFPFLPQDFRNEYYQAAPADQWIDYPEGEMDVELINLTSQGRTTFSLPELRVPFEFFRKSRESVKALGIVDTVLFEPDKGQFSMTARCAIPLKKNIHEMSMVVVGTKPSRWYEKEGLVSRRSPVKQQFESLDEMIKARKRQIAAGA